MDEVPKDAAMTLCMVYLGGSETSYEQLVRGRVHLDCEYSLSELASKIARFVAVANFLFSEAASHGMCTALEVPIACSIGAD